MFRWCQHLFGLDLIFLALVISIWPHALQDETATFIHNEGGVVHSQDIISWRMADLDITKKKVNIECGKSQMRALVPELIISPGVHGLPQPKHIHVDEFNISHKRQNRRKGWAPSFRRVCTIGNCAKGEKLTVMMVIQAGDPDVSAHLISGIEHPRSWILIHQVVGTTGDNCAAFIDHICSDVEGVSHIPGTDDHTTVFLCDNL